MKWVIVAVVVLVVLAVCVVAGCRMLASRDTAATLAVTAKAPGRVAIVFYSQSKVRNTALLAQWIQKHIGGDLIEVEPEVPYPEPYSETLKEANRERKAGTPRAIRPVPSLDGYEVVFVGSPIWYGTYAPALATFLKDNPLPGKTVIPFSTHGGGGAANFERDLKAACPGAKVLPGFTARASNQIERRLGVGLAAHHTEDDVVRWLNGLF